VVCAAACDPDVGFVVSHASALLDKLALSRGGPQPAGKTEGLGPALECPFEIAHLRGRELGWPPVRSALRRPCTPELSSSRAQRLTDCRWTPTLRATSDWLSPALSNRAASIRRASNPAKFLRTPAGLPCATH
jgi:hypothetical protein